MMQSQVSHQRAGLLCGAPGLLQVVLDAMVPSIAILDESGTIVAVNASWRCDADRNGLTWPDYGVGRLYLSGIDEHTDPNERVDEGSQGILDVIAGRRQVYSFEYPCHSPTEQKWYTMSATRFTLGTRSGAVISHTDITRRRLQEIHNERLRAQAHAASQREARRRQESDRRRRIAEGLRDVLAVLNSNSAIDVVLAFLVEQAASLLNARAAVIYQQLSASEDLVAQVSYGLDNAQDASCDPIGRQAIREAMATEHPVVLADLTAEPSVAEDRPECYGACMAVPILVRQATYGGILLCYARPRTFGQEEVELAMALTSQAALAIDNSRLRQQVEREAVAAERSRLVRELHDSVTQSLFSAGLIADGLPRIWHRYPDEAQKGLHELSRLTHGALAEMRALLLELRPAVLAEKPLAVLLGNLVDAHANRSPAAIDLVAAYQEMLPANVQIALYRITEEALHNVFKHASARQVTIALRPTPEGISLSISDDGRGFSMDQVPPGHLGLSIIHERARAIGADVTINSQPKEGTRVGILWHGEKNAR